MRPKVFPGNKLLALCLQGFHSCFMLGQLRSVSVLAIVCTKYCVQTDFLPFVRRHCLCGKIIGLKKNKCCFLKATQLYRVYPGPSFSSILKQIDWFPHLTLRELLRPASHLCCCSRLSYLPSYQTAMLTLRCHS